jgi:hypothetical protein
MSTEYLEKRKKELERWYQFGYMVFRLALTVTLAIVSAKVSAEQNASGVSAMLSPSFFLGILAVQFQSH